MKACSVCISDLVAMAISCTYILLLTLARVKVVLLVLELEELVHCKLSLFC
jgi:hypothetical protein